MLITDFCMTKRGKNYFLKVRWGRRPRVGLSSEYHFKISSEREESRGGTRMSEKLVYADLNLTESTRPKLQKVTDVQGR